jgi:hypothetical protein
LALHPVSWLLHSPFAHHLPRSQILGTIPPLTNTETPTLWSGSSKWGEASRRCARVEHSRSTVQRSIVMQMQLITHLKAPIRRRRVPLRTGAGVIFGSGFHWHLIRFLDYKMALMHIRFRGSSLSYRRDFDTWLPGGAELHLSSLPSTKPLEQQKCAASTCPSRQSNLLDSFRRSFSFTGMRIFFYEAETAEHCSLRCLC